MPMINLFPKRTYISSPLVEDLLMESLRSRVLELSNQTDYFFINDYHLKDKYPLDYYVDVDTLKVLIRGWFEFRRDCGIYPISRFRILHRLRLNSLIDVFNEQISKIEHSSSIAHQFITDFMSTNKDR
ncbi:hypothetical protein G3G77_004769 [Salmonella enterica]|nr:hypothetical protein [Salmonella enterica]EEH5466701.1 hypothetical protein [Salmonella enterica]EEH7556021.1 hypothetical protein [Salmonella enterica]EEO5640218.1 hypothetical protein [Salmonella enterica]EEQ0204190.1 hypothetical protein [Salmonella enterica]